MTQVAAIIFSVDSPLSSADSEQVSAIQSTAGLFKLFREHKVAATWAFEDPAASSLARQIDGDAGQEVAILGDASWVGRAAGRSLFARELARRVLAARNQGLRVSTLALREAILNENLDLLVRHQIRFVRDERSNRLADQNAFRARSTTFGVWQAPGSLRFSLASPWRSQKTMFQIRQAIKHAVLSAGTIHLHLDMGEQRSFSNGSLAQLRRLCLSIRQRVDKGELTTASLSTLGEAHAQQQSRSRARSILHAAA